jgi:uncharacterized repeat protein (TIGR03803 family)
LTTLASLAGTNGGNPQCQLAMDASGNLYGTAPAGGPDLVGTVFRVTTNGSLTTLVSFNHSIGASPEDGLTAGIDGDFYGTTADGGSLGLGTVFRMTPGGGVISSSLTNGANPLGGLVQGNDGTLYGTTGFGGNSGFGTIFKVTTTGVITDLFDFHFTDGAQPASKLIFGPDGSLYGTTGFGGSTGDNLDSTGLGTVFRITTNGVFTPLVLFQGTNGSNPSAPLVLGNDGNLYGTTANGGPGGGGTIFRIVLTSQFTGIAKGPGGSVVLTGTGPSGEAYRLLASTNVSLPIASWTSLTTNAFDTNGQFSFTDAGAATVNVRFYRISVP